MTDGDVIERVYKLTGIGNVTTVRVRFAHHKQQTLWCVSKRTDVVSLITKIRPWMGLRRAEKIDEMLAFDRANPITRNLHKHGTRVMYEHWKCRCGPCRTAAVSYQMNWRRNNVLEKKQAPSTDN